jgi:DNA-binding Lrp family transcriptional regulator
MPATCYMAEIRMIIGVAMMNVVPGQERLAYCFLKGKEGILDFYHVFGEYDFFLIMQAESLAKLKELVEDIQESHHIIRARFIGKLR